MEGYEDGNLLAQLGRLKGKYPRLKINLSIGGWGAEGFSDVSFYREWREKFVENVMEWMEKYDFDGVDIDWEYPVDGGGGMIKSRAEDRENFTKLMEELREGLICLRNKTGKSYSLSFAAGAFEEYLSWIEPTKLARIVDYVNLMAYDFYGPWTQTTGHISNLFLSKFDPEGKEGISANRAVKFFLRAGFPSRKIVLGVPFYGRAWEGVENVHNGLYQPYSVALEGMDYGEIKALIPQEKLQRYWDEEAKAPFLYNGDLWISFEDPQSLRIKCDYIKKNNLAGIMFWEYTLDPQKELLNVLYENLRMKRKGKFLDRKDLRRK